MEIIKSTFEIISPKDSDEAMAMLQLIELAARNCYKSEDKITDTSWEPLVRSIISRGHEAMLEFGNMTVRFICDRGITHELVRHRLCAFAQESTRYCNYKSGIQIIVPEDIFIDDDMEAYNIWKDAMWKCEETYNKLIRKGYKPQIARGVLPTCLKTEIVMQANLREWRHIFQLRTNKAAHPQMRELMIPLLINVKRLFPIIFDDVEVQE